jgi:hypothetical protein
MKKSFLLAILFFVNDYLQAQSVPYPLHNEAVYHQIDRFEILYGNDNYLQTTAKPYTRADVIRYALHLDSTKARMSKVDQAALQYLFDDNNELLAPPELPKTLTEKREGNVFSEITPPQYRTNKKPIFKYFYRTPANLYETHSRFFDLKVNPIYNFKLAKERDDDQYLTQRGIDVRGSIDNRVYFQTNFVETQARFPEYINARIKQDTAIPGTSLLFKPYNSNLFSFKSGYDYLNAQGLVGFNITPHIGLQLGNGQHFIGDGLRSLFLSNFANNYFFMKLNTKVWKLQYQNIFAELAAYNRSVGGNLNYRKYMATHQLSFNVNQNLNFGIFETVIMNRTGHFELQYLNPIIFYRSVEHSLGSPDNVLLGANFKWNMAKRFSIYGQLILDEFVLKALFIDKDGWWANKFGNQIGIKYFNVLNIDHLDMQVEYNRVRPFTYSYYDNVNNYTHAYQNLAHPIGANFHEIMAKLRYQPTWKLVFDGRLMYANVGENSANENWGNRPYIGSNTRKMENGYFIGEGVNAKILLMSMDVSYQLYHNMFADLHFLVRKKDSEDPTRNQRTVYAGGGLRINFGNYRSDY